MSDELKEVKCPGLCADWINGWLAAVGATVLEPRLRLHWTRDAMPVAVLSSTEMEPVSALVAAWPDDKKLADLPIERIEKRLAKVGEFRERAKIDRGHSNSWTLTSMMTDLCGEENDEVKPAPFYTAGPGSIGGIHQRLTKAHTHVQHPESWIPDTLSGFGRKVIDNGLGFDLTRIGSQGDSSEKMTDPVAEVLAFFGLALFAMRGKGVVLNKKGTSLQGKLANQKGWMKLLNENRYRFFWPAWGQRLDKDGIDALLDAWKPFKKPSWPLFDIHAGWKTVEFKASGPDMTRAFGSERL